MPRLVKPIQDNDLPDQDILRREDVYLSADTYSALVKLAKRKLEVSSLTEYSQTISTKRATELALFWVKSGQADPKIISKLRNAALFSSTEALHEACLQAFLAANPTLKIRERGEQGRPRGFVPPAKRLKIAIGEVISDLINSSPITIKLLKVVK